MKTPDELRALTEAAIARGKEEARLRAEGERAAANARRAKEHAEAQEAIALIPAKCEESANKGKTVAIIYEDRRMGYSGDFGTLHWKGLDPYRKEDTHSLSPVGAAVYQSAKDAGLDVFPQYAHDGVGMSAWINICVRW